MGGMGWNARGATNEEIDRYIYIHTHTHIYLLHLSIQHCKATVPQLKKKNLDRLYRETFINMFVSA